MDRLQELVNIVNNDPILIPDEVIAELISYGEDTVVNLLHLFSEFIPSISASASEIYLKMVEISVPTLINILDGNFKQETHLPIKELQKKAALALGTLKDVRAIEPLLECIKKTKDAPRVTQLCYCCAKSLAQLGEPALQRILELLNDTNLEVEVLYWIIETTRFTESERVAVPLIALANHPNAAIREGVVSAFAYNGLGDIVSLLTIYLAAVNDDDSYVRQAGIRALGSFKQNTNQIIIRKAVEDPDIEVRIAAFQSISHEKMIEAYDMAHHALLNDENVKIRRLAAKVLGSLGVEEAIPALLVAMKDPEFNPWSFAALDNLGALDLAKEWLNELLLDSEKKDTHRVVSGFLNRLKTREAAADSKLQHQ